jgi:hypothetical protein
MLTLLKQFVLIFGMKNIIDEIIDRYGVVKDVQERFGYTAPMGVYNWRSRGVPKSLLLEIHIDTGIDMSRLLLAVKPKSRINSPRLVNTSCISAGEKI